MNWADYGILAIIVVSALFGLLRGFTREFFGLATWLVAIVLTVLFGPGVAQAIAGLVSTPIIRTGVAYGAVFLGTLLVGGILTALMVARVRESKFSSADRTLGGGLGLIRGILIVAFAVLFVGVTSMRESAWWKGSTLIPPAAVVADGLRVLVPDAWLAPFRPDPAGTPEAPPAATAPSAPSIHR